jgi:transposase-like protein
VLIRRRLPRVGDQWHFDEVVLKIGGVNHWLWRAMGQAGVVLDVLVQRRRDKQAAKRMLSEVMCARLFRGSRIYALAGIDIIEPAGVRAVRRSTPLLGRR